MIISLREEIRCKKILVKITLYNRRFMLLKLYYDLVLDVIIWGFKLPASMWYFCGSLLGALSGGIDVQSDPNYPVFSDITQCLMFLFIYLFTSKVFTVGWDLSETFDLNKRHEFTKMDINLFIKDNIKSIVLWVVFGGPAIYVLMKVIEWGGDMFPLYLLILTISYLIIFKYLYLHIIGPMYYKFE